MAGEQDRPRPRKTEAALRSAYGPYIPTKWAPADVLSLQRVRAGTANAIEQKRAIDWILKCSGLTDEPYRPGDEAGRRDTDFALGKANVGRQIAKLLNLDLGRLRGGNNEQS